MDLQSNGAKNRETYDNPCHMETTQVTVGADNSILATANRDHPLAGKSISHFPENYMGLKVNSKEWPSPAASSPFYTPAATPDRQSATPPAFSRNTQLDTEVDHLAGLLTQHSLKDLMVNQELAEAKNQGSLLGEYHSTTSIVPQQSQYTPPESPEVQDDRTSYNRRYGHLFYKGSLPYKFFDGLHPDRNRDKRYGGLWTHFGDGNGALNGFTENLLEQTMRIKVREEDEREDGSSHWLDQVKRRLGRGHFCHAWGNYDPYSPNGNRSGSPEFYFGDNGGDYHHLLDF